MLPRRRLWGTRMGMADLTEQLDAVYAACRELGAEVRRSPEAQYLTAMVGDGWDQPYDEGRALAVQKEIKRKTAQYPGLVCSCFDPFSTLVYTI